MDGTIRTSAFTVDRAAYLRTMYTYNLPLRLGGVSLVLVLIAAFFALDGQPAVATGLVVAIVVYLPLLLVLRYVLSRRNVYRPTARRVFDDPRTMDFSSKGIHTLTEGGLESTVPWTHVVKAVSRGGFTLFFTGPIVHLIVPDSAFASDADRQAVASLAAAHVATPGRKGK